MVHKPQPHSRPPSSNQADDLESAINATRRKPRFRDVVNVAVKDSFHSELKKKLKQSVDSDKLERYRKPLHEIKQIKNKKIRHYYEAQNERLNDWLEVDARVESMADDVLDSMNVQDLDGDGVPEMSGKLKSTGGDVEPLLPDDERERRAQGEKRAKWAININVIANVLLLAAKSIAATQSSSLSLIASLVDSALDLLCTLIIYTTNKLVQWRIRRLQHKFPVGRRRLEPLGILAFSIIMIVSFLQILQESVTKLLPGTISGSSSSSHETTQLPPTAIGALVATVVVKGVIWFGCIRVKTTQVQALAQDCKTDVVFNTLSLLFPVLGHAARLWWLDPVGAALLSLFIIYDWAETLVENVARLTGAAVDDRILKKVTYMAWRFAPVVEAYKTITAYHAGDGVWVEMDIMMDEETKLGKAHDVAETLQYCLEGLGEVDRAFVTVDCEFAAFFFGLSDEGNLVGIENLLTSFSDTSQGPLGHSQT